MKCQHDLALPDGPESFHKLPIIAQTFGVTVQAIIQRIRLKGLPASSARRWTFVSDTDLRAWFAAGIEFRNSNSLVIENALTLSCGHVVERVALGEKATTGACRHDGATALHRVKIIATTYGVTEPAVLARIRTARLPVSGADGKPLEPRKGVPIYVSDENLRTWIGAGIRFGNGAPILVDRAPSPPSSGRSIQLSCGWTVGQVPEAPLVAQARGPRLVGCLHDHPSGPVHSIAAVALTRKQDVKEVFRSIPTSFLTIVGDRVYADASLVKTLGVTSGTRLACGWVTQ